jgi:hypothetical protein
LTQHWAGYLSLIVFAVAYILAMTEEVTELKKSKPMVFAASLIWIFIAAFYNSDGMNEQAGVAFRSTLEGYGELFLFIMVSMTYLNALEDMRVFEALRNAHEGVGRVYQRAVQRLVPDAVRDGKQGACRGGDVLALA